MALTPSADSDAMCEAGGPGIKGHGPEPRWRCSNSTTPAIRRRPATSTGARPPSSACSGASATPNLSRSVAQSAKVPSPRPRASSPSRASSTAARLNSRPRIWTDSACRALTIARASASSCSAPSRARRNSLRCRTGARSAWNASAAAGMPNATARAPRGPKRTAAAATPVDPAMPRLQLVSPRPVSRKPRAHADSTWASVNDLYSTRPSEQTMRITSGSGCRAASESSGTLRR